MRVGCICLLAVLAVVPGCGEEEHERLRRENDEVESQIRGWIEADDTLGFTPDVACVQPKDDHWQCSVYKPVGDGTIARHAVYDVRLDRGSALFRLRGESGLFDGLPERTTLDATISLEDL